MTAQIDATQSNDTTVDELAILAEQTSLIFAAVNNAIIATFINSLILVAVLWPVIEHQTLISWLLVILLISLGRGIFAYRYRQITASASESYLWSKKFLIGSTLASITWGSASIWLFPADDIARQVFLAFVIGGMAAGAITSLSYMKVAIYLYLSFTLIPLFIRFFYSNSELNIAMGTMICLYLVVLLQAANSSYQTNRQNICMRIRNTAQENSLQQSEHRYKTLLETATDAFFLHDLEGRFVDVNNQACRSVGYSRDELLTMSVRDVEISKNPDNQKIIWPKLEQGENVRIEGIHCRKDGSNFPVEVSLGLVKMDNQNLISVLARDITERNRIDKIKNEFISTVSHELRTPLTSIKGSLGLILGGAVGELPKEVAEMLKVAGKNADRLLLLVNDVLDVQKLESGQFILNRSDINVMSFLEQALSENKAYAEEYDVKFIIKQALPGVLIYADKDRLMQVMANMFSNAAKFSHENGNVEISVMLLNPHVVRISIIDHGAGIPKDFQSKIFDKFTQSDSSDTRKKGGTGLGLNISKSIIEKHGGEISFDSIENEGSRFNIDLPKYDLERGKD